MKLAILGADPTTAAWAKALAQEPAHEVVLFAEWETDSPERDAIIAAHPQARRAASWEVLLDPQVCDAVLVASGDEAIRSDQLRKLVQNDRPVLMAHPCVESMLLYYELEMIRGGRALPIIPDLSARFHPLFRDLQQQLAAQSSGSLSQIVIERQLADRSPAAVRAVFARDLDLIRSLVGEMSRLAAQGAENEASPYGHLGVQMVASSGTLVRWGVGPVESQAEARWRIIGSQGKWQLVIPHDERQAWQLESGTGSRTLAWDPAPHAIAQLATALQGQTPELRLADAARSLEVTEAIPRSLARGRTVQLLYEEYTEQGTFKGKMAAWGCGLLLLILGLLGLISLLTYFNLVISVKVWGVLAAVVLLGFLGLQLLAFVIEKPDGRSGQIKDVDSDD